MNRSFLPVLALSVCLAACSSSASVTESQPSLAATSWQLVAIQSMDDSQGTTPIANPERFTAHFTPDGRVSFRLDCNRGMATWASSPSGDGTAGTLRFGPLATTRAMCPPPHLDQRVARDLGFVRSYLFKEGNLFLSLEADGGMYEWQPAKR
jgi:heat shock protein HslJ